MMMYMMYFLIERMSCDINKQVDWLIVSDVCGVCVYRQRLVWWSRISLLRLKLRPTVSRLCIQYLHDAGDLSVSLSVCVSVCLSVCVSVCLSVSPCLCLCLSVSRPTVSQLCIQYSHDAGDLSLSVCLSLCLPVCLPVCLSVCLYLSVCVCLSLRVCVSVCLCLCRLCLSCVYRTHTTGDLSLSLSVCVCLSECLSVSFNKHVCRKLLSQLPWLSLIHWLLCR